MIRMSHIRLYVIEDFYEKNKSNMGIYTPLVITNVCVNTLWIYIIMHIQAFNRQINKVCIIMEPFSPIVVQRKRKN